jgi:hypothetical protein
MPSIRKPSRLCVEPALAVVVELDVRHLCVIGAMLLGTRVAPIRGRFLDRAQLRGVKKPFQYRVDLPKRLMSRWSLILV